MIVFDCRVHYVVSVTDGDTIRAVIETDPELVSPARTMTTKTRDLIKGEPLRLINLQTPERGEEGWREARAALSMWLARYVGQLRVATYESAGWDRLLGDVYVDGDRGNTATQYMLLNGWEPYVAA